MAGSIKESDWKLLRKKLPGWQEAHMEKILEGYVELIEGDDAPSTKFWELDRRMRQDKRSAGVMVAGLSRSNAMMTMRLLLADGVITPKDLSEFSDEARNELVC